MRFSECSFKPSVMKMLSMKCCQTVNDFFNTTATRTFGPSPTSLAVHYHFHRLSFACSLRPRLFAVSARLRWCFCEAANRPAFVLWPFKPEESFSLSRQTVFICKFHSSYYYLCYRADSVAKQSQSPFDARFHHANHGAHPPTLCRSHALAVFRYCVGKVGSTAPTLQRAVVLML